MWVNYTSIFFIETICCIRRMWVRYTPIPFNWQSAEIRLPVHAFFLFSLLSQFEYISEIRVAFPKESQVQRSRATQMYFIPELLYEVCLCGRTTGCEAYSFTTDEYWIFHVFTNLGSCRTHDGGSGTNTAAQELTRRDRKPCPHPASPGDPIQGLPIVDSCVSGV